MSHLYPTKNECRAVLQRAMDSDLSCATFTNYEMLYFVKGQIDHRLSYSCFIKVMSHLYQTGKRYRAVYEFNGPAGPLKGILLEHEGVYLVWTQSDPSYGELSWCLRPADSYEYKSIRHLKSPMKTYLTTRPILEELE